MIQKFALFILLACSAWVLGIDQGRPQAIEVESAPECSNWHHLSFDKPGSYRLLYAYHAHRAAPLKGETIEEPAIRGVFRTSGILTIALWTESESEEIRLEFTTPVSSKMDFVSDDGRTTRALTQGRLLDLPSPLQSPIECLNESKGRTGSASPRRPAVRKVERSGERNLGDLAKKLNKGPEK